MSEELASIREVVDLSPPHALDEAEYFLVGQGYVVVNRTATTLTVERDGSESITSQESTPKLMVMAVPQPDGGVKIKVRGTDREGMRQQQARWTEWADGLPKRQPPLKCELNLSVSRLDEEDCFLQACLSWSWHHSRSYWSWCCWGWQSRTYPNPKTLTK
jgi:hypothetical protein